MSRALDTDAITLSQKKPEHRNKFTNYTVQIPTMSGITDEAAIEGHDFIHNAEVEEERACWTPVSIEIRR